MKRPQRISRTLTRGRCLAIRFRSRHAAAYELSKILDTGLDKETLSVLVALCENGVNPEVSEADSDADASPARD